MLGEFYAHFKGLDEGTEGEGEEEESNDEDMIEKMRRAVKRMDTIKM